jgi:hypothetical protein
VIDERTADEVGAEIDRLLDQADRGLDPWRGVICSHGCTGLEPCEHVVHLVQAIKADER